MLQVRLKITRRILESTSDFVKRYAGNNVSFGYRGNKKHSRSKLSITNLAYLHEVGDPAGHFPARPFMRQSLRAVKGVERLAAYRRRKNWTRRGLENLARKIATECGDYIYAGLVRPPLARSTVKRKGHNIPLVETGELANNFQGWVSNRV